MTANLWPSGHSSRSCRLGLAGQRPTKAFVGATVVHSANGLEAAQLLERSELVTGASGRSPQDPLPAEPEPTPRPAS
jgi:hypothetical protein